MSCPLVRDDIDSYLDGELEPGRLREVEDHLAACPGCARWVHAELRVRERLGALCSDEVAPQGLRERVAAQVERSSERSSEAVRQGSRAGALGRLRPLAHPRPVFIGLAAAAAVAALLLVWTLTPHGGVQPVLAEGLAHDHETHHGASGRESLFPEGDRVRLGRWFEERLGTNVVLGEGPPGARLIGGQICVVDGRRVAHAIYDVNGATVSFFVLPSVAGPERPVQGAIDGLTYVSWNGRQGRVYVLGSVPLGDLMPFRVQ